MKRRGFSALALVVSIGVFSCCAQATSSAGTQPAAHIELAAHDAGEAPRTEHLVFDTGVESTAVVPSIADWSVPVNTSLDMRAFASSVIAGRVVAVEGSWVDASGGIVTTYTVQVERVFKGEGVPETVPVTLPGGTVPLGEYIERLDQLGLYDMKLGGKNPTVFPGTGEQDARTMDPATPVSENRGTNPTSASLLAEVQPDSWVFFIGAVDGDINYGAGFDHALGYVKHGQVYNLHPETDDVITESALLNG